MRFTAFIFFILVPLISLSQLSNLREKSISLKVDSVLLDSVSIVPGSVILMNNGQVVETNGYRIDYIKSLFTWNKSSVSYNNLTANDSQTATIYYRVFSFSFVES